MYALSSRHDVNYQNEQDMSIMRNHIMCAPDQLRRSTIDPTKVAQMVEVLKELTLVTPSAAPASLSTLNIMEAAPWARVLFTLFMACRVIALGPSRLNPLTTAYDPNEI
jgi:hypothetical protein